MKKIDREIEGRCDNCGKKFSIGEKVYFNGVRFLCLECYLKEADGG